MKKEISVKKIVNIIDIGYCALMGILILSIIICVSIVKKSIGATAWGFSLLFLSPAAGIISLIYLFRVIIGIIKKKKIKLKIAALILSLLAAYPLLILFGLSRLTYPNSGNERPAITISIPLKDKSDIILLGGEKYKPHAIWGSECYAYDIVKKPYDIKSTNLNDFGIFGEEIISPVAGTVIAAYDDEEDIPANQDHFKSLAGNYVYIKMKETNTYLMFVHLKQNSVIVNTGDLVNVGDTIGQVGNSGTTSEPHLHLQHQKENPLKTLHTTFAQGLPIIFTN